MILPTASHSHFWPALSVLVLLLCLHSPPTRSQPAPDSSRTDTVNVHRRLALLVDAFGISDQTSEQLAEHLATLAENPFDLNRATAADLTTLPGLTAPVAYRIVQYRADHGPFESVGDLRAIEGVTPATLGALRPFLIVESPSDGGDVPSIGTIASNLDIDVTQRATRRLNPGRGYVDSTAGTKALGSPVRLTTRLRMRYERRAELSITLDKDPGEPLRWAPSTDTYGFDHVTGSLALYDLGPVHTLVVGDFTTQFGQGLTLWHGLRFGKGRDPVSPVLQSGRGLLPYGSASEDRFFRGAAATLELPGNLALSAFASRRHRDATLDSSFSSDGTLETPVPVRTVSSGGMHRTPSELAGKGTFGVTTVGGAMEYRHPRLRIGVAAYQSRFDRPLRPGDRPYRRYRVSGRSTALGSAFASASIGDYVLFGEVGRAPSGPFGGLVGAALDDGETVQAVLLGRAYPARFSNFYGNAFSEGSRTQNEIGVYTGLRLQVAADWRVGAYLDQYRFPWIRFNVPRPSDGWEARIVLEHEPRPWLSSYLQLRSSVEDEGAELAGDGARRLEGVQRKRRQSARLHTEYTFSDALTLRTRLEASYVTAPDEHSAGVLVAQGLRYRPLPSLQIDTRLAFFQTDGFAARIYSYEHDLRYSFSVPALFDRGRRTYVLVQYEPLSSLTLEAKYGVTSYVHRTTIGSGLNEVHGSRRRELRLQIRWEL